MTQSHPSYADIARRERLAESTLDLLAFDTQNPPGETTQLLAWLEDRILNWGVDTEWIESVDGKPNLVAIVPGDSEWTLLYEGHVDTAPYEREA
ncbi:hypothetical protein [Halohasta salina]|uniref:hypothetical protein n=1 Tax=Halohasta salina TaxID=2961621 RepID=UPI0020A61C17|nr:hypothetical protein [Halohasta salina]